MKKFKLMLVAFLAMIGVNAFAADPVVVTVGDLYKTNTPAVGTTNPLTYTVTKLTIDDKGAPVEATVNVKQSASIGTTTSVEIPATVTFYVEGTYDAGSKTFAKNVAFTVTEIAENGFKNNTSLTEVKFAASSELVTINANAFLGATGIEAISLPASVVTIGANAFDGAAGLSSITLPTGSMLHTIGNQAFNGTSLITLDLSNAKNWVDKTDPEHPVVKGLETIGAIFAAEAGLPAFKSMTLPETVTTIGDKVFKDSKLATINLGKVTSIGESAFEGTALSGALSLLGNIVIKANAFKGTKLTAVTFGDILGTTHNVAATAFAGVETLATVNFGAIANAKINNVDTDPTLTSIATFAYATTLNLTGKITNIAKAAGQLGILFQGTAALTAVNYTAAVTAEEAVNPFTQKTFADAAPGTAKIALTTTLAVSTKIGDFTANTTIYNVKSLDVSDPAEVKPEGTIGAGEEGSKKLLKDKNSSNYYYYHTAPAGVSSKIAKEQNGANVVVYSAYLDFSDMSICMNPLALVNGNYIVNKGQTVIVKSNKENAVEYYAGAAGDGSIQMWGAKTMEYYNFLQKADQRYTYANIYNNTGGKFDAHLVSGRDAYDADMTRVLVWNNPETYGWTFTEIMTRNKNLAKNAIYIVYQAEEDAGGFDRVKWLDEDGNVTAIQEVKKANAVSGAIYNLAGQKVNASYKGVVIKDGKKYIQK